MTGPRPVGAVPVILEAAGGTEETGARDAGACCPVAGAAGGVTKVVDCVAGLGGAWASPEEAECTGLEGATGAVSRLSLVVPIEDSGLAFGSAVVVNVRSSVTGFGDSVRSTTTGGFSAGGLAGIGAGGIDSVPELSEA